MQKKSSPVYLYEVDDLLGGDALTPYDLASLAGNDIRWLSLESKRDNEEKKAA
tara:strand:- start:989 stop:1147 length:159 start_codon:yes stop_codon:yes gene_type:complete